MLRSPSRNHQSNSNALGGGIVILIIIAAIWLLIWAWPWWLFLPPIVFCVALVTRPKLRSKVKTSLSREDVEPDIARFRKVLMFCFLGLGVISAIISISAVGLENLEWWLIPLTLVALAIRLLALSVQHGRWPRLQTAILKWNWPSYGR